MDFPTTSAQRQAGADDSTSIHYPCGYLPDATGGSARGKYQTGTTPCATCGFTKSDSEAHGMYTEDNSSRRESISGKWLQVQAVANEDEARCGDNVADALGTAYTDLLVLNTRPDGNNSKMEVLICYGQFDDIDMVLVNDLPLPHTFDDTIRTRSESTAPTGFRRAKSGSLCCQVNRIK